MNTEDNQSTKATEILTPLLTTKEVATLLKVKEQTLRKWRLTQKKGPPWIVLDDDRSVRYEMVDVVTFLNSRKKHPSQLVQQV